MNFTARCNWSASHLSCFTLRERATGTHYIRGWVSLSRSCLPLLGTESWFSGTTACSLDTIMTELTSNLCLDNWQNRVSALNELVMYWLATSWGSSDHLSVYVLYPVWPHVYKFWWLYLQTNWRFGNLQFSSQWCIRQVGPPEDRHKIGTVLVIIHRVRALRPFISSKRVLKITVKHALNWLKTKINLQFILGFRF